MQAHPVTKRWKEAHEGATIVKLPTLAITAGEFNTIPEGAEIHAERVIIRAEKAEKKR